MPAEYNPNLKTPREGGMLYKVGRFLQLLGLLIAPAGIAGNIVQRDSVTEGVMLMILAIGGAVFLAGWYLQQACRRN